MAASRPDARVGLDLLHRPQRRGDEGGDRIVLGVERRGAGDQARPGQRRDVVDAQDRRGVAVQLELDRLVVREARRGVHGTLRHGDALGEVRVLDDLDVLGRQVRGPEQRLQHDPARAVPPGRADLAPFEVRGGLVIPLEVLAKTTFGNLP